MAPIVPGKTPANDAEWSRDVLQRLERLESPGNVTVGSWTLHERDGDLHATKAGQTVQLTFPGATATPTAPEVTRNQQVLTALSYGTGGFGVTNTMSFKYRGKTTVPVTVSNTGPVAGDMKNALVALLVQYTANDFDVTSAGNNAAGNPTWIITYPGGALDVGPATTTSGGQAPIFTITNIP